MLSEFTGRCWENGEFGLACSKTFKLEPSLVPPRTPAQIERAEWIKNLIEVHGADAVLEYYGFNPLGSSTVPKTHRDQKRGLNGITPYGSRLVRNACLRLERENPKDRLSFATFTLPDVSVRESVILAQNWAQIVRVFIQRLRRHLIASGLTGEIVGATEIQEKRMQRDGIVALHLHLVFLGRHRKQTWAGTPELYRQFWRETIEPYLFEDSDQYNWSAVENIVRVKQSAQSYLGKYLSKGVKSVGKAAEEFGTEALPTAWYTITNTLRSRVHLYQSHLSGDRAKVLLDHCCDKDSDVFVYRRPIELKSDSGRPIFIGWYGKLKPEWVNYFQGGG